MDDSTNRKLTSIRFKPELMDHIKELAAAEGNTFTDTVETLLEESLPKHRSLISRIDTIEKLVRRLVRDRTE